AIFAVVDASSGRVITGPHIQARGMAEDDKVFDAILPDVASALNEVVGRGNADTHQMQQAMRRVVGRWAAKRLRRSPMLIPTVVQAWRRRSRGRSEGRVSCRGGVEEGRP